MDDTRSLFEGVEERIPVPPGDLGAVVRTGRGRRRRRLATGVVSAVVVAVAGWGAAEVLGGQDARPVPATPDEVRPSGERLVPVVTKGPAPSPDLASADDLADARAITVAFHAFLEGTGRRFEFDYEGFGDFRDEWWVRFAQYAPPSPKERALAKLQRELERRVERLQARLVALRADEERLLAVLQDARGEDARRLRRNVAALRGRDRTLREEIRKGRRRGLSVLNRRRGLFNEPAPYRTEVTVVERDGMLVVDNVFTDSPEIGSLVDTIGYSEPVASVDAWGADYYDATFRPRDGAGDGAHVEVFGFWTGPMAAPHEERCRPQVVTRSGEVVWTERRGEYEAAPRREEIRDSLALRFDVDYAGDVGNLTLRMRCDWRAPGDS
jgi:hypothetical protein